MKVSQCVERQVSGRSMGTRMHSGQGKNEPDMAVLADHTDNGDIDLWRCDRWARTYVHVQRRLAAKGCMREKREFSACNGRVLPPPGPAALVIIILCGAEVPNIPVWDDFKCLASRKTTLSPGDKTRRSLDLSRPWTLYRVSGVHPIL